MAQDSSFEAPKRLRPTAETARKLYLLSGNCCAYDGCSQPLMTPDGVLVGEIAHIEAAMPGGAVFEELHEFTGGDPALIRRVLVDLDLTVFDFDVDGDER